MLSRSWAALSLVLPLAGLASGCGGGSARGTYVTNVPRWDYSAYERIAVVPPRVTDRRAVREAELLVDRLTTLLAGNGAFTVLSRAELKDVLSEQDLAKIVDVGDEEQALPEGKVQIAQAIVATKITDYKLIAEQQQHRRPVYQTDRHGRILLDRAGRPIIAGEEVVTMYRHGAAVEGSVRVIDAATGKILLSHSARIEPDPRVGYGRPPRETPDELAAMITSIKRVVEYLPERTEARAAAQELQPIRFDTIEYEEGEAGE